MRLALPHKFFLAFVAVAVLVGGLGVAADALHARLAGELLDHGRATSEELEYAASMALALEGARSAALSGAEAPGAARDSAVAVTLSRLAWFEQNLQSAWGVASRRAWTQDGRPAPGDGTMDALQALAQHYYPYRAALQAVAEGAGDPAALEAHAVLQALQRYRADARRVFEGQAAVVDAAVRRTARGIGGVALAVLLAALGLGIAFTRWLARPLADLTAAVEAVGSGQMTQRVHVRGRDEVARLGAAFNRMTEALRVSTVSKHYLDNVVHSVADLLVVADAGGRIHTANGAALRLSGRRALDGLRLDAVLASADGASLLDAVLAEGRITEREALLFREGASPLPVLFSGAVLHDPRGRAEGVVCVAQSLARQKETEAALVRARKEAEDAARMKSTFLTSMSHEIRTPLNGIIGSAQMVSELSGGEVRELAEMIEAGGMRLLDTINAVLDMARLESGAMEPVFEAVDVRAAAREVGGLLRRVAERKGLALDVAVEPGVTARADRGAVQRILYNLVGNALKFTERGGVTVEAWTEGDHVILQVADTGIGIAEAFLPSVFEEFSQASTGLHRRHEGTGLGLAITRRMVAMGGGEIGVESTPGEGTTFMVRLPAAGQTVPA